MDAPLVSVAVAAASAAVVLRVAWRYPVRADARLRLPIPSMVAHPMDGLWSELDWLLTTDPDTAYALHELGRALEKASEAAPIPNPDGPARPREPATADLRPTRAHPRTRPAADPRMTRPQTVVSPDPLRRYLERMEARKGSDGPAHAPTESLAGAR